MNTAFISDLLLSTVRMATPILLVALAELYSERAGLVNIGLDGIMTFGALSGFMISFITGSPLLGLVGGVTGGILINMIYAYCTITLCAQQIVYGMAINIFAPALAAFTYRAYFGVSSVLPQAKLMPTLGQLLGQDTRDMSFLARLFLDQPLMVYFAYALVIFTAVFFSKTKAGLNYKAVGEFPKAAETLGINVIRQKYLGSIICGALAGLGGAYLTTCYVNTYSDGVVAGRGFIALAAVIFGRWTSGGVLLACLFFGFCDALQLRLQIVNTQTPYQLFQMIPYLCTLVVLAIMGVKKAGPKSKGQAYRREER